MGGNSMKRLRMTTTSVGPISLAVLATASLLLAGCGDDLAQNCPPLAHPPVLTVAAASNPCQAKAGETADLLVLRVVRIYQRSAPFAPGRPTRFALRCGNTRAAISTCSTPCPRAAVTTETL
jgi:hypothetical protein